MQIALEDIDLGASPVDDMALRQRRATRIVTVAVLAGLMGDLLLRANGIGINLSLYLFLVIIGVMGVTRLQHGVLPVAQWEPLIAASFFAACITVRDASLLTLENVLAALGSVGIAALWATQNTPVSISRLRARDVFGPAIRLLPRSVAGGFSYLRDEAPSLAAGRTRYLLLASSLGRAGLIALACSVAFGLLLAQGDAVFREGVRAVTRIDAVAAWRHLVFVILFSWPVLSWLHASTRDVASRPRPTRHLGSLDTTSVLGGLLLVFGLFLAVQVRILFGGQAYVASVTGLSLAEYARSGFFSLVGVTALVLGVLLALDAVSPHGSLAAHPRQRSMAKALVVMVVLMLVSAAARMALYVEAFGLTTERLHAIIGMVWIGAALAIFVLTALRGRRERFSGWALRTGWVALAGLNIISPDAMILRVNLARAAAGAEFDAPYHAGVSADAAPLLVREFTRADVSVNGWCRAAETLLQSYGALARRDLTAWNLGHQQAARAVAQHEPALRAAACPLSQ